MQQMKFIKDQIIFLIEIFFGVTRVGFACVKATNFRGHIGDTKKIGVLFQKMANCDVQRTSPRNSADIVADTNVFQTLETVDSSGF